MALGADELKSKPLQSMFAVPFLSPTRSATYVPLVLFIDTEKLNLFSRTKLRLAETVYEACRGFVGNIEAMKTRGELFFSNTQFRGYKIDAMPSGEDQKLLDDHVNLTAPTELLDKFEADLKFKSVFSFNADFHRY